MTEEDSMYTVSELRQKVEKQLEPSLNRLGMIPSPLKEAMTYSLMAGGKRIRPVLLLAACDAGGGDVDSALPFACALEMIHTYSCIHDDLPGMDNDVMRRGKPCNHVVYGVGMGILSGDGLLSAAGEILFQEILASPSKGRISCANSIFHYCGVTGMVAGQNTDLFMEGKPVTEETVRYIHTHKTADMITAAVEGGLHLAEVNSDMLLAGTSFGRHLGLAFQQMDDLLDVEGDAAQMGKTLGKDAEEGKQTWIALRGAEGTREDIHLETGKALASLEIFQERGKILREIALSMLGRNT